MKKSTLISSLGVCLIAVGLLFWYSSGPNQPDRQDKTELTHYKKSIELEAKEVKTEWVDSVKNVIKNTSDAAARFVFSMIYK